MINLYILKYFSILFTFTFLFLTSAGASTDLGCADIDQNNTMSNERWKCPSITENVEAILSDVDVETGTYTCEYRYIDTQEVATTCTYNSLDYKEKLEHELDSVHDEVVGIITGTNNNDLRAFSDKDDIDNFHRLTIGSAFVEAFADDPQFSQEENLIHELHTDINDALGEGGLYKFFQAATDAGNYLYKLNETNITDPLIQLQKSYTKFVKPYTPGGDISTRKEKTFSRFITGMVTLNNADVIDGYYEDNGTLDINSSWSNVEVNESILTLIKKMFAAESNNGYTINTDRSSIGRQWKII